MTPSVNTAWTVVKLDGEFGIANAAEIKAQLLDALMSGQGVRIQFGENTALDVTILQLLYAAKLEAKRQDVNFDIDSASSEPAAAAIAEAGLTSCLAQTA